MNRKMHTKLTTTKTTSKTFYQKQTQLELERIYGLYRGYSFFYKIFWPVHVPGPIRKRPWNMDDVTWRTRRLTFGQKGLEMR